jgi:hypothetical protein
MSLSDLLPPGMIVRPQNPTPASNALLSDGWARLTQLGYSRFRPAAGSLMLGHRRPPIQTHSADARGRPSGMASSNSACGHIQHLQPAPHGAGHFISSTALSGVGVKEWRDPRVRSQASSQKPTTDRSDCRMPPSVSLSKSQHRRLGSAPPAPLASPCFCCASCSGCSSQKWAVQLCDPRQQLGGLTTKWLPAAGRPSRKRMLQLRSRSRAGTRARGLSSRPAQQAQLCIGAARARTRPPASRDITKSRRDTDAGDEQLGEHKQREPSKFGSQQPGATQLRPGNPSISSIVPVVSRWSSSW